MVTRGASIRRQSPDPDWPVEIPGVAELRELAGLDEDWDTYGGLPPSHAALNSALKLLRTVHERCGGEADSAGVPYSVSPLATGGVEAEWRASDRLIRVDIGPEGELDFLVRRDINGHREYTERHGSSVQAVLTELRGVLAG